MTCLQRIVICVFLSLFLFSSLSYAQNKKKATLRFEEHTQSNGQKTLRPFIEFNTSVPLKQDLLNQLSCSGVDTSPCVNASKVDIGGLFSKGEFLTSTEIYRGMPIYTPVAFGDCEAFSSNSDKEACNKKVRDGKYFRIYLAGSDDPLIDFSKKMYVVGVYNFVDSAQKVRRWHYIVNGTVKRTVSATVAGCPSGRRNIGFLFDFATASDPRKKAIYDWTNNQLKNSPSNLKLNVNAKNSQSVRIIEVEKILKVLPVDGHSPFPGNTRIGFCIETKEALPQETFNVKLSYSGVDVPDEVLIPELIKKLDGVEPVESPNVKIGDEEVGARDLDRNIDFGIAFSSSVVDEEENGEMVRKRKNQGIFDVRAVPWRIFKKYSINSGKGTAWYREYKPIYIDAKVSTASITEETLATNTVNIGTDFEFRYYTITKNPTTYYRFNIGAKNVSDRDFKQAEFVFNSEFRPIFSWLNKPLLSRRSAVTDPLTGEIKSIEGNSGFRVVPVLGLDFGRTWRRKNPAEAVEERDPVLRGYFGAEIEFSPVKYLNFTVNNTFYIRSLWESKLDRARNFFSSKLEVPLGSPTRTPQSLFFSFEKGDKPPFNTAGANVFKIGYRIRTDWHQLR